MHGLCYDANILGRTMAYPEILTPFSPLTISVGCDQQHIQQSPIVSPSFSQSSIHIRLPSKKKKHLNDFVQSLPRVCFRWDDEVQAMSSGVASACVLFGNSIEIPFLYSCNYARRIETTEVGVLPFQEKQNRTQQHNFRKILYDDRPHTAHINRCSSISSSSSSKNPRVVIGSLRQ